MKELEDLEDKINQPSTCAVRSECFEFDDVNTCTHVLAFIKRIPLRDDLPPLFLLPCLPLTLPPRTEELDEMRRRGEREKLRRRKRMME